MKSYIYNDANWRLFKEIDSYTIVRQFLIAKELHQIKLRSLLFVAANLITYSCKEEQIYFAIFESENGYFFQMKWKTSKIKSETIREYIELFKKNKHPDTGNSSWKKELNSSISNLLGFSSVFLFSSEKIDNSNLYSVEITAEVKFESLIDSPQKFRFYKEAPQRQLSIFDIFEFEKIDVFKKKDLLVVEFKHSKSSISLYFKYKEKEVSLYFSEMSSTHHYLIKFLDAIINIYHKYPDEDTAVNVFCKSTGYTNGLDLDFSLNKLFTVHTRYWNGEGPNLDTIDMKIRDRFICVLIRKNPDLEYEDDWFYNLSDEEFDFEHQLKSKKELEDSVLLAIEVEQKVLLTKVYHATKKLIEEFGAENYKVAFNNDFPYYQVSKIEQIIKMKFH